MVKLKYRVKSLFLHKNRMNVTMEREPGGGELSMWVPTTCLTAFHIGKLYAVDVSEEIEPEADTVIVEVEGG